MAKNLLRSMQIDRAKPREKEYLLSDGDGLYLRIRPNNARGWFFIYSRGGKREKIAIDGSEIEKIRARADEFRGWLADGIDPKQKLAEDAAARAQAEEAARLMLLAERNRITVQKLFERWDALELSQRKPSSRSELKRAFSKDVLPVIGHVSPDEVTRAHVMGVLDAILARGARRLANRTLADLRQMFGFGYVRGIVQVDPTHRIKKMDVGGREVERSRVLGDEEIRELAVKMATAGMSITSISSIYILLSTGVRVGDLLKGGWDEINFDAATWTFQPEKDRAHIQRTHTVYLSDFALKHFRMLHQWTGGGQYLYPTRSGKPASSRVLSAQVCDRQRGSAGRQNRTQQTASLVLSGGRWTPHDLRRTAATMIRMIGYDGEVAERCLYHLEPDRLKRIYHRHDLTARMREAWQALGERLEVLTRIEQSPK